MLKKVLASLIAVGALGSITATGTFALLTSQESNSRGTIASGTLVFDDVVNTGSDCFSYGAAVDPVGNPNGNVNTGCQALLTSSTLNYPGVAITPIPVKITNTGSIDAASLSVYMPSCAQAATSGAPSPGGANPCAAGGAMFYVQEVTSTGTPTTCWFPSGTTTCAFVANALHAFAGNFNAPANALSLGSGPAHGQTRYFQIGMELPSTASNALQGEEAVFGLTWHTST